MPALVSTLKNYPAYYNSVLYQVASAAIIGFTCRIYLFKLLVGFTCRIYLSDLLVRFTCRIYFSDLLVGLQSEGRAIDCLLTKVVLLTICVRFNVSTLRMESPPVESRKTNSAAETQKNNAGFHQLGMESLQRFFSNHLFSSNTNSDDAFKFWQQHCYVYVKT
jgi:hypothetical protein